MNGTEFFTIWHRLTEDQRQRVRNKARWEQVTLMATLPRVLPEHGEGSACWCGPRLSYEDPVTEAQVWVHGPVVS